MIDVNGPYRIGAIFFLVSAVLHILAFLAGGFTAEALRLIPIGIVYVGIAYLLFSGSRLMAYIAFVVALVGGIIALFFSFNVIGIPGWWWNLITIADWIAAGGLFMALWRSSTAAAPDNLRQ